MSKEINRLNLLSFKKTVIDSPREAGLGPSPSGFFVQRALEFVRTSGPALGLEDTQPPEFGVDPNVNQTSSGASSVHLQQQYKGIPIFQASQTVRFDPDGSLRDAVGSTVGIQPDKVATPELAVEKAVFLAAEHVAKVDPDERPELDQFGQVIAVVSVDISNFVPGVIASFPRLASLPTVLDAGPFGDEIQATLIWFPEASGLILSWEVNLTMPRGQGQYRVLISVHDGSVLYCSQIMSRVAATGNVYRVDGGSPRQMTPFPRKVVDYDLTAVIARRPDGKPDLPDAFPDDWVDADSTVGNGVSAHLGDDGPPLQGTVVAGGLTFNPADPTGDEQKVVNIFYFCCLAHDYFYLLGFREAEGNFQRANLGRGGVEGDPVNACAHQGTVWATANMSYPVDGKSPTMNMGLVTTTNRHTAFDATVVVHEFSHGVTNRLVGGALNDHALESPQSAGMGEGWGDYFGCTVAQTTVVAAWLLDDPRGIRGFPYDSSFPDDFGKIGTGRYTTPHNIGEIWCAALMEINRRIGDRLASQLVVDALKLSQANPGFLDMRDSVLRAFENKAAAAQIAAADQPGIRAGIWGAFTKFGMGVNAKSNGSDLSGIVADFQAPASPQPPLRPPADNQPASPPDFQARATPNVALPDKDPVGVVSQAIIRGQGTVRGLKVSVDVAHPFASDLRIELTSPANRTSLLQSEGTDGGQDLTRDFSAADTPSLATMIGASAQGTWSLRVSDMVRLGVGTFRSWELTIDAGMGMASPIADASASPSVAIPDKDPTGVSSSIRVAGSGRVASIRVEVDISHPSSGDLELELVAPSGKSASLRDSTPGGPADIKASFDPISCPALSSFVGESATGDWTLRVADLIRLDTGILNKWRLILA